MPSKSMEWDEDEEMDWENDSDSDEGEYDGEKRKKTSAKKVGAKKSSLLSFIQFRSKHYQSIKRKNPSKDADQLKKLVNLEWSKYKAKNGIKVAKKAAPKKKRVVKKKISKK